MLNYFSIAKFFLYIVPLAVFLVTPSTLFPFIVGKYVFFRTAVDLALIFFLLGLLLQDKLSVMWNKLLAAFKSPLVIAVSIFAFIFVLAGFFGVDPANSFWSNFERGEGGSQIIHLWLFFLLLAVLFREEKDWRKLFWMAIIGAVSMIFYGIFALQGINGFVGGDPNNIGFIKNITSDGFRFIGSIGNPAYVATYLIFAMFYALYLFITRLNTDKKQTNADNPYKSVKIRINPHFQNPHQLVFLIGLIIFFLFFFWLAATRGGFMGLVVAIVLGGGYFAFSHKQWRKWLFAAIVVFIIAISAMVYFKNTAIVKSIPGSRIFDLSFSVTTWEHRTYMWKMAWDGFKERPLFGWGPENYINIFDRHFNTKYFKPDEGFGAWFDRAHSVYFDYLAETGILGLLSYLGIFAVFYWQFFTKNPKSQIPNTKQIQNPKFQIQNVLSSTGAALLFAMPIAYLVQGLVLFEVLPLYLNLFLFLAFANYKIQKEYKYT